jgi:hypothetical protein
MFTVDTCYNPPKLYARYGVVFGVYFTVPHLCTAPDFADLLYLRLNQAQKLLLQTRVNNLLLHLKPGIKLTVIEQ